MRGEVKGKGKERKMRGEKRKEGRQKEKRKK